VRLVLILIAFTLEPFILFKNFIKFFLVCVCAFQKERSAKDSKYVKKIFDRRLCLCVSLLKKKNLKKFS